LWAALACSACRTYRDKSGNAAIQYANVCVYNLVECLNSSCSWNIIFDVLDEDRLKHVKAYHSSDSVLREFASKVITVYLQKKARKE
jgi:hypothetical protein